MVIVQKAKYFEKILGDFFHVLAQFPFTTVEMQSCN